jgi:hypothetical protein
MPKITKTPNYAETQKLTVEQIETLNTNTVTTFTIKTREVAIANAKSTAKGENRKFAYVSTTPKTNYIGDVIKRVNVSYDYFTSDENFTKLGFTQHRV